MTEEVHRLLLSLRRGGKATQKGGPPLLPIERLADLQESKTTSRQRGRPAAAVPRDQPVVPGETTDL